MKICKIINGVHTWILEVDGMSIPFQSCSGAEYFETLYLGIGYRVEVYADKMDIMTLEVKRELISIN